MDWLNLFSNLPVSTAICDYLTIQQIENFRQACRFQEIVYSIVLTDAETCSYRFDRVCPETFAVYQSLQEVGSTSLLLTAAKSANFETINFLLNCSVQPFDINRTDIHGENALMYAIWRGNPIVVEYLIEKGINIDHQNQKGESALILAAKAGFDSIVASLLKNNANYNLRDSKGNTALIQAVGSKRIRSVELLLEHGADPNFQNDQGKTALIICVQLDFSDRLVKRLVTAGSRVNFHDNNGRRAIDHAKLNRNIKLIKYFLGF